MNNWPQTLPEQRKLPSCSPEFLQLKTAGPFGILLSVGFSLLLYYAFPFPAFLSTKNAQMLEQYLGAKTD